MRLYWIAQIFDPVPLSIKRATEQRASKRQTKIDKRLLNGHPQTIEILVYGISEQIAVVLVVGQTVCRDRALKHNGNAIRRRRQESNFTAINVTNAGNSIAGSDYRAVEGYSQITIIQQIKFVGEYSCQAIGRVNIVRGLIRY
ncbi:hypothetical protein AN694_0226215 [Serratia marcescens]|uniref:Uncharacterized protein n=1 Tax=Serratia marcescens TaxID=615 RepID=A0A2F0Q3A2_SERMA|nr:hypothetical protein AN694_0226215 [Serratia marcescens]OCO90831.1 hypothetical protein AN695_0227060 [Serratia marcescens]